MLSANQSLERHPRRSWSLLVLLAVLGMATTGYLATGGTPAYAFQEGGAEQEGEPVDDADQADDQQGDETAETGQDEQAQEEESFLSWMVRASGMFGFVLLILSFIMVALIMMNILQVRRDNLLPPAFIEAFEQKLGSKDYQGAYETAKNDDSVVARVLAAGLSKLNRGYSEAIEGMQEVGEDENMALEHRLSYLALIGTIAPMIGLMGTVYGMIDSFQTIARSVQQPKPADLADGISTALFTTLEGLAVAIPAMIFYSLLRNRVSRFVLEVGMVSEGLMSRFASVGRRSSGGGSPATAPAAPNKE